MSLSGTWFIDEVLYWCGSEFPLAQHTGCSARLLGFDPVHIEHLAGLESDITVTPPTEFISVISISLSFSGGVAGYQTNVPVSVN